METPRNAWTENLLELPVCKRSVGLFSWLSVVPQSISVSEGRTRKSRKLHFLFD